MLAIKERYDERSGEEVREAGPRRWLEEVKEEEAGGPSVAGISRGGDDGGQDAGGNGAVIRDSGSGDGADSDGSGE